METLNPSDIVLVTGGSGLLGNGFLTAINYKYMKCTQKPSFVWLSSKDGDLRDLKIVKKIFEKYKPSHVVHLAARVGGLFSNLANNIGFFRDNMAINDNVVRMCELHEIRRAIFCLSTCVFPSEAQLPLTEEMLHAGPPHSSNIGYSMAKRMLEMIVKLNRDGWNRDWTCIIPTNLYGPEDNFNLQNSHVIPGLIHKCYIAKKENRVFTVAGSGNPLRQFLYIEDAGNILLKLLLYPKKYPHSSIILCGDPNQGEHTIREVAEAIVQAIDFKGSVVFDTSKSDGIERKTASNTRLREMIGHEFAFTDLQKGLSTLVEWFKENYDTNVRK